MDKFLNRIIKLSIYLLVFLLPLFFLPFSFEVFEFNKQYLLFFLVSIAFLAWLIRMIVYDKELRFRRTPLNIPVLVFIFVAVLSAIFSIDKTSSLFGSYGRFSDGLIGLLSLGALYFLMTNNVGLSQNKGETDEKDTKYRGPTPVILVSGLLKVFISSVSFVILISYFSIFRVWGKLQNLTGKISALPREFNTIGSPEALAIFLSIITVLLIGCLLFKTKSSKSKSFIYWLLLIAAIGLLLIIDFGGAWIVLILTLTLLVGFTLWKRIFGENVNKLLLPIFLVVMGIIFLFSNPLKNGQLSEIVPDSFKGLPREQILDQASSWKIGFRALTEDVKSGFLGSGSGTFFYDFSKFKPKELNQSPFWQLRYNRAGNHIAEIMATMGFLGLLSYLVLIGMFLLVSYLFLQQNKRGILLLMVFLALLIGQFVFYQNTVLAFAFWLVLGLSVVNWQKPVKEKTISFKDFPELSLIFSLFLIILGLVMAGMYFFAINFYLADAHYAKAMGNQNPIENLEKAINLNPYQAQYKITLARFYLNEVQQELQKPQTEQNLDVLAGHIQQSLNWAQRATEFSPRRVFAWETLGIIYRDVQMVTTGATQWGIDSFEKAIILEPTNPVLYTELGKLYLASDQIQKAKEKFERARELKPNYGDALIQEVLITEMEGDLAEAIRRMEDLALNYPFNIEILFQLGRLYYNNKQIDEAISQFDQVLILFPNHSNSLYSLGMAYQQKGQKEDALKMFERVLELNPGNADVLLKIEELKKVETKIETLEETEE